MHYDVLVVGGGHSGCEAALSCAKLGFLTLLVTNSIDKIGVLSCNPAIGGIGKGHLVKELDVLGGVMSSVADQSGIHFHTLNTSKGAAVRSTRCQVDMDIYRKIIFNKLLNEKCLVILQDDVINILLDNMNNAIGINCKYTEHIYSKKIILTTGTFLNASMHVGNISNHGGRFAEYVSGGLFESLKKIGFNIGNFKTGTCARLDSRSIDYRKCKEQKPISSSARFSFYKRKNDLKQISCWITHTVNTTHSIIKNAIYDRLSPSYNGNIKVRGPRYCLSIEDKIIRFPYKNSHHIFLEPQGLNTYEVYPNGLTTSLPPHIQIKFLRTIPGLEHVHVTRWGYAVEYCFIDPRQCQLSLESKLVNNLYLAGQINGTTGYEEAAIQGLIAGLNAARSLKGEKPIILSRHESYCGVLIDDLVAKGVIEPYRMFTSRAEYRLLLREDNVYKRLIKIGFSCKLINKTYFNDVLNFESEVMRIFKLFSEYKFMLNKSIVSFLCNLNICMSNKMFNLKDIIRRPEIKFKMFLKLCHLLKLNIDDNDDKLYRVFIEIKYEGYIKRIKENIVKEYSIKNLSVPSFVFTHRISGLSNEVFEKLRIMRPSTMKQVAKINGITPAALALISMEIKKHIYENI